MRRRILRRFQAVRCFPTKKHRLKSEHLSAASASRQSSHVTWRMSFLMPLPAFLPAAGRTRCGGSRHSYGMKQRKCATRREWNRGAPCRCLGLFQRDFAHEFATHNLANFQTFGRGGALFVGVALDLPGDRVEFFPRIIERSHVLR